MPVHRVRLVWMGSAKFRGVSRILSCRIAPGAPADFTDSMTENYAPRRDSIKVDPTEFCASHKGRDFVVWGGARALRDASPGARQARSGRARPGVQAYPRGLRHSFGGATVAARVPLRTIAAVRGYASISTTAIYTTAIDVEVRFASPARLEPHRKIALRRYAPTLKALNRQPSCRKCSAKSQSTRQNAKSQPSCNMRASRRPLRPSPSARVPRWYRLAAAPRAYLRRRGSTKCSTQLRTSTCRTSAFITSSSIPRSHAMSRRDGSWCSVSSLFT